MGDVITKPETGLQAGAQAGMLARRAGEALLFAGVIALSSFAVLALAVAAPFVLTASALSGIVAPKAQARGWRPASA
ncbi:MAG: hypothetical protein R3C58_11280 [Parvularculaceae bacterium]